MAFAVFYQYDNGTIVYVSHTDAKVTFGFDPGSTSATMVGYDESFADEWGNYIVFASDPYKEESESLDEPKMLHRDTVPPKPLTGVTQKGGPTYRFSRGGG